MWQQYNQLRYDWQLEEVKSIYNLPFNDLLFIAQNLHRINFDPNSIQISSILNIKKGACPEDCKFCGQSAHYTKEVGLKNESFMPIEQIIEKAKKVKELGGERFCMVAAWRRLHDRDVPMIVEAIQELKNLGLESCMSLGMITKEQALILKDAGLDYYNHNLETSAEHYSNVVTTHTHQDRVNTVKTVRDAGIKVCSGGILGLGEEIEDRLNLIITLANQSPHPESVPINMLVNIKGTPLADTQAVDIIEFVRIVALAKILMPNSRIRLSGGRVQMSEADQALCFLAGASSIHYAQGLLVTPNNTPSQDIELFKKLGLKSESGNFEKLMLTEEQYNACSMASTS